MEQTNILFVLTDQQRFDTCGCYGQKLNITPNLDQLANEGVLFKHAFSNQPVCGPTRSILQTGKYATETGCYRNGIALPTESKTIAHYLSEKGYCVGYIGKWHLASTVWDSREDIGEHKDFMKKAIPVKLRGGYKDFWKAADVLEDTSHPFGGYLFDENMNKLEFSEYRVDTLTNYALDFLDEYGNKNPFFLYLSYLEPHQQNDLDRFIGPKGSRERFKDFEVPGDLKGTEGDWKENFPDYLGCCNSIDDNLNQIHNKLKELELEEKTIIIYFSDHGCHFKTRNDEYKRSCHEASIRVPLIIKGADFFGGKIISELVSTIDIPPTI
jgi:uncharacterized sulfatase